MTLEEFAAITRGAIFRDGFERFLPTACFPERQQVTVLTGIPDEEDVEAAAIKWATSKATPGEEVLVAIKVSPVRFKIVRREGDVMTEQTFDSI